MARVTVGYIRVKSSDGVQRIPLYHIPDSEPNAWEKEYKIYHASLRVFLGDEIGAAPLEYTDYWPLWRSRDLGSDYTLTGVGGTNDKIWAADTYYGDVHELSTADLSVLRTKDSPATYTAGHGGDESSIWHGTGSSPEEIHELSPSDFSSVRKSDAPYDAVNGLGGNSDTIWYAEGVNDNVHELSPSDFSVIRSSSTPEDGATGGAIGGDNSTIWFSKGAELVGDSYEDKYYIYELAPSDFSVVRARIRRTPISFENNDPGIGGTSTRVWNSLGGAIKELASGLSQSLRIGRSRNYYDREDA